MNSRVNKQYLPDIEVATLRISEVFVSLQGEADSVGIPTVFIRLTGCPLRCQYCDTSYAFTGGEKQSVESLVDQVADFDVRYVTVTGGEPLAQPDCLVLLTQLCDAGYRTSLETSGAMDVSSVDSRVIKVLDIKTPGSGEADKNRFENINYLARQDQVKFVICDRQDYEWACIALKEYSLVQCCDVLFSPSHEQLAARMLADWIVEDRLPVRFQIQLHKYIWGNEPGR
jgi:7-carboxy-7-deazaguanine synthase